VAFWGAPSQDISARALLYVFRSVTPAAGVLTEFAHGADRFRQCGDFDLRGQGLRAGFAMLSVRLSTLNIRSRLVRRTSTPAVCLHGDIERPLDHALIGEGLTVAADEADVFAALDRLALCAGSL
jgi:hypothetical protein